MSEASWRLMALAWLPIPAVGPFLCKATEYLNSHTLIAVGRDGPELAPKLKEVPSVSFDSVHGRDEKSLRALLLQDSPMRLQIARWACDFGLLGMLVLIQLAYFRAFKQSQVDGVAACLGLALVISIIQVVADLVLQVQAYRAGQCLVQACEALLVTAPFSPRGVTPKEADPLQGLQPGDALRTRVAWRQLKLLSWTSEGRLPATVYAWLNSAYGRQSNIGRLFLRLKERQYEQEHRPHKVDIATNPKILTSVMLACQVLLLRAAAHNDICIHQAFRAAQCRAETDALEAAKARAASFRHWTKQKATVRAAAAGNALLEAGVEHTEEGI
ncbi:unnamed protein product [Symbiodinium natans]|uniref:Uncharacterized protein n=1 Tax=Symbiodinium natans TaxID=878477 RepID=A0A812UCM7_9DINO|nr:unnamed protein product [Symbiodinium natans]